MKTPLSTPSPRLAATILAATALFWSASAQAQLISSWSAPAIDDGNPVSNFTAAWLTDVTTGTIVNQPVLGSSRALAADPPTGRLFASTGSSLNTFVLDASGSFVRVGSSVRIRNVQGVAAESYQVLSMGFANGVIYASVSRSPTDERRGRGIAKGFYVIDPATAVATPISAAANLPAFVGLDYNPNDGLMYGIFGAANAQSIVSLDLTTFTTTTVASLPASAYNFGIGSFEYDGLAVGRGKVYLTHGQWYASIPILVFDLGTRSFGPSLKTAQRSAENRSYSSGATFFGW